MSIARFYIGSFGAFHAVLIHKTVQKFIKQKKETLSILVHSTLILMKCLLNQTITGAMQGGIVMPPSPTWIYLYSCLLSVCTLDLETPVLEMCQ